MSKALAVLFTGVGTATVGVGGVYLVKGSLWGGKDSEEKKDDAVPGVPAKQTQVSNAEPEFKNLSGFKGAKGGSCVKKYLGNDVDFSASVETGENNKITADDFSDATSTNPESCLVVSWEKTGTESGGKIDSSSNRWKGGFRWLWTFVKGDKGFVLFLTTKENIANEKQFDLEGGIYLVEKATEGEPTKWSVKKKKELETAKNLGKDQFDSLFPLRGEGITPSSDLDNWGFVTSKEDLEKLCKDGEEDGECSKSDSQEKKFNTSWVWSNSSDDSAKTIDKWTSNAESNISSLFGSEYVSLSGVFSNIKGTWGVDNSKATTQSHSQP